MHFHVEMAGLSFYELVRELQGIKDLCKVGEVFRPKVPEEKLMVIEKRKGRNYQTYKILSLYCREVRATWEDVISALNEIGMSELANDIKRRSG